MTDKLYFPGLNTLRFYAALSVVIVHIEQVKGWFGLPPAAISLDGLLMNGDDAVTLFFALSGFLITYLLLAEQTRTGTIHVRKFYARRILRIWPLYYLLVFIGFALMPLLPLERYTGPSGPHTPEALLGYMLFVPNALPYLNIFIAGITHLWTIGVEEQFYVVWPLLLRGFRRHVLAVLLAIIALKLAIFALPSLTTVQRTPYQFYQVVDFLNRFRIENMAVGGIGAYLLFSGHPALRLIFHPLVEKTVLAAVIAHTVFAPGLVGTPQHLAMAAVYTLFMLNVACNPRSTIRLEHPLLNRLGQCSYGIYMYHLPVIYLIITMLRPYSDVVIYAVAIAFTVGLSLVSYRIFEQPFLRLKARFAAPAHDPIYPKFDPSTAPDSRAGGKS